MISAEHFVEASLLYLTEKITIKKSRVSDHIPVLLFKSFKYAKSNSVMCLNSSGLAVDDGLYVLNRRRVECFPSCTAEQKGEVLASWLTIYTSWFF